MPDRLGSDDELGFINEDSGWLRDSYVTSHVREESGRYWVDLLFTDRSAPARKLLRPIDHYATRTQAAWYANILLRQVRADPRDDRPQIPDDDHDLRRN